MFMEDRLCASSSESSIQIKTGIDIVCIKDIQEMIDAPIGVWLTEREWKDTITLAHETHRLQRLAGKFACKEAILKVLESSISETELVDIEVLHNSSGKPIVFLQGSALSCWMKMTAIHLDVSISHEKDFAVAIAVAMCWKDCKI
ncbi:hypothetical protein CEN40_21160 [Fischerella thermalis CCMEE 5205]|nr:hypothetical protein CEN40_21160 [Fischerella thermalis CCMEE 5205]PMB54032.1 hypothetical protein CEN39_01185 [Fischerella thermalis CCMEE 5201]